MSSCSAASPMVCHPNYVQFNRREVVTVVYAEPMFSSRPGLTLEVVESSGTIVARETGQWNGDRVFTFTCPPLTAFGYHEVTPIVQREGRERKLPTFSICCSISWQLSEQLHRLSSSDSLFLVCLVALHLCKSVEQSRDPYWDAMCQMALDSCVKQPHTLVNLGFPGAATANVPIRELFGNMFRDQTLQQFMDKHKLVQTSQTLNAMSVSPQDEDGYEDLDTLRSTSVIDCYDDASCIFKHTTPAPGHTPNPVPGYTPNPIPGYTPNPAHGYTPNPVPGHTPNPAPGYTPNPAPGYTPNPAPGYTPNPVPGHTPNPIPCHTPNLTHAHYSRMIKASPTHSPEQPGPAHPNKQLGPPPCPPPQSKKPPLVPPKPGPAPKTNPNPLIEEDYTPFAFEAKETDEELSDSEEYMIMEDPVMPDRRTNYSTSTIDRGRTPQPSGARQRSQSALSSGHCKVAPVTPPRANVTMATQGSCSKLPLQPPHSKTLPWAGVNARRK